MACYRPIPAFRESDGSVVFRESRHTVASLDLPCGACVGCQVERAREWSMRIQHEAKCWPVNSVVTLTYDDKHYPPGGNLVYRDFQLFMHRLRKLMANRIRFFVCGEYGARTLRPHYHAVLFNTEFKDRKPSYAGHLFGKDAERFVSAELGELWPHGLHEIDPEVTGKNAAYIARYVTKKLDQAVDSRLVDSETGEVLRVVPEFIRMSTRPGLGAYWYRRYGYTDVFPHDRVILKGDKQKPPRYYMKLLDRGFPFLADEVREKRVVAARRRAPDNSPPRLKAKETVAKARLDMYKRELK